jgi:hypothetical protein
VKDFNEREKKLDADFNSWYHPPSSNGEQNQR